MECGTFDDAKKGAEAPKSGPKQPTRGCRGGKKLHKKLKPAIVYSYDENRTSGGSQKKYPHLRFQPNQNVFCLPTIVTPQGGNLLRAGIEQPCWVPAQIEACDYRLNNYQVVRYLVRFHRPLTLGYPSYLYTHHVHHGFIEEDMKGRITTFSVPTFLRLGPQGRSSEEFASCFKTFVDPLLEQLKIDPQFLKRLLFDAIELRLETRILWSIVKHWDVTERSMIPDDIANNYAFFL